MATNPFRTRCRQRPHRLHCSGFVVRQHQDRQAGLRPQQTRHHLGTHDAVGSHRQPIDRETVGRQLLDRPDDGRMLDETGQDMSRRAAGEAEQCQIVPLRGAAGEDDLAGISPKDGSDLFACILQGTSGVPAGLMSAGRIAVNVAHERLHGFPHGRQKGGGGVVVEVDGSHGRSHFGTDQNLHQFPPGLLMGSAGQPESRSGRPDTGRNLESLVTNSTQPA